MVSNKKEQVMHNNYHKKRDQRDLKIKEKNQRRLKLISYINKTDVER